MSPLAGFSEDPLRELVGAWVDSLSPNTRRAYQSDLAHFGAWTGTPDPSLAAARLFALDAGEANLLVLRWRAELVQQGASTATVARKICALRSLNSAARMCGLCSWSLEVKGPKVESYRDTAGPGKVGYGKMKAAAAADPSLRGFRDRAVIALAHDLGLRRAEVIGLDIEHVERGDERPVAIWVKGKGRSDRQRMSLPAATARILTEWITRRGQAPGALFHRLDNAADDADRGRLSGESVRLLVGRIGREAGLDRAVRPHGLRHQAITAALDATGGDIRAVAQFSRHKSIQTVVKYDDARTDQAGRIAAMVAGE